jgi:hypothetical protein
MALTVIFFLSTVLILTNIEPFRITGIFLSICYLPGLCFFTLIKKRPLCFEDLILAFACSIGISSILSICLLFAGIRAEYIVIIIQMVLGILIVLYLFVATRRTYASVELSRREIIFCLFAFLTILFLSMPFFLGGPNRIAIAGHVFHHSSMVTQILSGTVPPENPGLGGTSIGYYWGFHSLIAALTAKANLQQIQIVFILNIISLFMIFCISYSFAKVYNLTEIYCYLMPLAVLGLMRFDAGILFLGKLVTGNLIALKEITATPVEPYDVLMSWIGNLPRFDTRLLFLRKFFNVSGMPLAICLCLSYLLLLLLILKRKFTENKSYEISIGVVIAACFFNYPPLAIFLSLHAPIWGVFIFLSSNGLIKERIKESLTIMLPYILSILIVLPYMLFVIASRDISSSDQGGIFSFDFYGQSIINIATFLIPSPLIGYGVWIAFKRLNLSREFFFILIGTVLCLSLSLFTRWPFDNSYKFNYILTFFFALLFIHALSGLISFVPWRCSKLLIISGAFVFLSLPTLIVEGSSLVSSFSTDQIYNFSNRHIIYAQDYKKNEAYSWIRENTPKDSLIMLSYIETDWPCCGFNDNYEPAAITERNLYVIKDRDYTTSNPEYQERVLFREKMFKNPEDPQVVDFFTSLNRTVYLLVEKNLPAHLLVEDRFKHFPTNLDESFLLKFHNNRQRVYLVDIKNTGIE